MTKTILILHGIRGKAGIFWQQDLADFSEKKGYKVIMPNLPTRDNPDRFEWIEAVKNSLQDVNLQKLIIVGHSLGVPAGLDYLETINEQILGFISVAGFYKAYGLELNDPYLKAKEIDINKVKNIVKNRIVIRSKNDPFVDQDALIELGEDFKADEIVIRDGEHFQHGSYIKKFPIVNFLVENT
ncbi:MAG TPA: alpha/beta fold hydrolase [Candidatus Dojkabacteria bacterium]|jgi:hypothetical protein